MQNSFLFVATATTKHFNAGGAQASADVNGNMPIQFTVLAGKAPRRSLVIAGTIAASNGIEAGKTYALQATLRDINDYGDNWNILVIEPVSITTLLQVKQQLGVPSVFDYKEVEVPVSATNGEVE